MSWVLLALAIAGEVAATLALRALADRRRRRRRTWITVVVVGYVASFALLGAVLAAGLPVGTVYAVWAAIGVAATAVLGRVLFRDRLPPVAVLGIAVIIVGVALLELGTSA